ncbi:hypothetical protein [Streptomyces sp. WG7]|uniref:hypothetical protein n=1 Tax=Streptomyces sp. WG7 TaxID=3417650 RepID=UPI003CF340C2
MLDRSHETQTRRAADPARRRPQRPQPALASLQASAGNRAVTAAIQRASSAPTREAEAATAEQRRRAELAAAAAEKRRQPGAAGAAAQQRPQAQEAAAAGPRELAAAAAERRRRAELAAAAAEKRREPEAAGAEVAAEARQSSGTRSLFGARDKLKEATGKLTQILGTSKADKSKKVLDVPDTMATRINGPTEGGVRSHGLATSNAGQVQDTAIQGQVGSGINLVTDSLGLFNDLRALAAGFKGRNGTGPESHKPRKDVNGKPLGAAQNTAMVVGDVGSVGNAAARNAGQLGGVTALAEMTGGATVVFSVLIATRDAAAIWKTYHKDRALKGMVQEAPGEAPEAAGRLQEVLDRLGQAQEGLDRVKALPPRRLLHLAAAREEDMAKFARQVNGFTNQLHAHLAEVGRYARHKQHTKVGKRIANLGGNSVRTAGGGLAIAAAAGAVSGPAAPAVAGVAAAFLLGNAVYKGSRAGSNRYEEARHPDRWARPTLAQGETRMPETPSADGAPRGDALKEFFKVTKSVKQGKRHFMAQQLYALAAGPDVPVGKSVPAEIRTPARALLVVLKAGPVQHRLSQQEWEESLNKPELQSAWEKEITNQLSSA